MRADADTMSHSGFLHPRRIGLRVAARRRAAMFSASAISVGRAMPHENRLAAPFDRDDLAAERFPQDRLRSKRAPASRRPGSSDRQAARSRLPAATAAIAPAPTSNMSRRLGSAIVLTFYPFFATSSRSLANFAAPTNRRALESATGPKCAARRKREDDVCSSPYFASAGDRGDKPGRRGLGVAWDRAISEHIKREFDYKARPFAAGALKRHDRPTRTAACARAL